MLNLLLVLGFLFIGLPFLLGVFIGLYQLVRAIKS